MIQFNEVSRIQGSKVLQKNGMRPFLGSLVICCSHILKKYAPMGYSLWPLPKYIP